MGWLTDELMCENTPFTNADRIRAMSDEELASWLALSTNCTNCKMENICEWGDSCTDHWFDWLKQEAGE